MMKNLRFKKINGLDASESWMSHEENIFISDKVRNVGPFYPIYSYKNYFSFSPFPLLLQKGVLTLNPRFKGTALDVARPNPLIDSEIVRLGGPVSLTRTITDKDDLIDKLVHAIRLDMHKVEAHNPGYRNIVLCGGKDSLNLLLLDWQNPITAYSAEPNFPLVQEFVQRNRLEIKVQRLEDRYDPDLRQREIAEAFCQVDLRNWKWAPALKDISKSHEGRVVIWKGQVADLFLTDYWRSYTSSPNIIQKYLKKGYRKLARYTPTAMDFLFQGMTWADLERSIWERAGVLQGAHMGFLRSICDCLVLSAYHGPAAQEVWSAIDFPKLGNKDLRPAIGRTLLGREVWYPEANPSPPASELRQGWQNVDNFVDAVHSFGVSIKS